MTTSADRSTSAEKDGHALAVPGDGSLYLTPPEAAALVRVCPKTLDRWGRRDASLPVLKIGGVTRYPAERFRRWLHAREQGQRTRNPLHSSRNGASAKATA